LLEFGCNDKVLIMNYIQQLTQYKAWADDLFLSTVAQVSPAELNAPRPIVFGSLIRTLNHSYSMDYVWQQNLLSKPHGFTTRNPEHCPSFDALAALQRKIYFHPRLTYLFLSSSEVNG
jgi:uncharacterized damage-inducible protein DinB